MKHLKPGFRFHFLRILVFISFTLMISFSARGQDQFKEGVTRVLEAKKQALGRNVCMLVFKDKRLVYEFSANDLTKRRVPGKAHYHAIVFVKNIQFKDRQKNYREIREAVNLSIE